MRRQTLTWVAPLGVVAVVVGGAAVSAAASTAPDLPERSAAEILASVADSDVQAVSGEIRTDAELGLPDLSALSSMAPSADPSTDASADSDPSATTAPGDVVTRLFSGENTIKFWTDGEQRLRVDLADPVEGARLVVDGGAGTAAFWSESDGTVTRYTLPDDPGHSERSLPEATPSADALTPQAMAEQFLAEADGTTDITVADPTVVAGRPAYVLQAEPRTDDTLVDRIVVAVDSATGVPLRAQVFAVDQRQPAFETGFVDIDFSTPSDAVFTDAFPADATVTEGGSVEDMGNPLEGVERMLPTPDTTAGAAPRIIGEDWSTVVEFAAPDGAGDVPSDAPSTDADASAAFGSILEQVDGGQVFSTALVNVLLTDDGRVLIGSVPVDSLVSAAES